MGKDAEITVEICGPNGEVHYYRPLGHPDILEALRTPGYMVCRSHAESVSKSLRKIREEAQLLLDLIDGLPPIAGDQQDRVFAAYEFDGLRDALGNPETLTEMVSRVSSVAPPNDGQRQPLEPCQP